MNATCPITTSEEMHADITSVCSSPLKFSFTLARSLQADQQLTAARLLFLRAERRFLQDPSVDAARDVNRVYVSKNAALPVLNAKVDCNARSDIEVAIDAFDVNNTTTMEDAELPDLFVSVKLQVVASLGSVWAMLISGFDDMVSDIDNSQAVLEAETTQPIKYLNPTAVHLDGSPTTTAEDSTTAPTPLSSEHVAMIMDWLEPELDELYETSSVVSIDESAGLDQDIQSVLRKEQDLLAGIMEVMDNLDMPCEWLAKYANVQRSMIQRYTSVRTARRFSHKPRETSIPTVEEEYNSPQGSPLIGKKVHRHNSHQFVVTTFHKPAYCHHCSNLLWGITSQGYKCVGCSALCHKKSSCVQGIFQCSNDSSTLPSIDGRKSAKGSPKALKRATYFGASNRKKSSLETKMSSGSLECGIDRLGLVQPMAQCSINSHCSANSRCSIKSRCSINSLGESPQVSPRPRRNVSVRSAKMGSPNTGRKSVINTNAIIPSLATNQYQDKGTWCEAATVEMMEGMTKQEIKRQEVIYELIRTEVSFVRSMVGLKEVYANSLFYQSILSDEKLDTIFSNLTEVLACCVRFCNQLLAHQNENLKIEHVAEMFGADFDEYKVFAVFCARQQAATDLIEQEKANKPKFMKHLNDSAGNPKCERYSLGDLMIMPMQRLTRYPLLLEAILRCTPDDHPDHAPLTTHALPRVRRVCQHVNSIVTKVSNAYKLQRLASALDCSTLIKPVDLYDTPRVIVFEGPLEVKMAHSEKDGELGRKSDKGKMKQGREVHAILLSDLMLLTSKKPDSVKVILQPIALFQLLVRDVAATATDAKSFYLLSLTGGTSHMHEFIAFSAAEKNKWISIIEQTIAECNSQAATQVNGQEHGDHYVANTPRTGGQGSSCELLTVGHGSPQMGARGSFSSNNTLTDTLSLNSPNLPKRSASTSRKMIKHVSNIKDAPIFEGGK